MMKRLMTDCRPWIENPAQPRFVRELLEAGRNSHAAGYDFEQGLHKHLARIAVIAPMPDWAEGLRPRAAATAARGTVASSATAGWLAALLAATFGLVPTSKRAELPSGATHASLPAAEQHASPPASVVVPLPTPVAESNPMRPARELAANAPTPTMQPAQLAQRVKRSDKSAAARAAKPTTKTLAPRKDEAATAIGGVSSAKRSEEPMGSEIFEAAQPAVALHDSTFAQAPERSPEPGPPPPADAIGEAPQQASGESTPRDVAPDHVAQAVQHDNALEREMMMLAVAQRTLVADPARALELARRGEEEFTGSMFGQERQQVLLLALVKLGRMDEAKRLARPFLVRYGNGPFSDRVRRALATGRVER